VNIVEKVIFDEDSAVKSITNLIDKIEQLDTSFDDTKKGVKTSMDSLSKSIVESNSKVINSAKEVVKANVAMSASKKDITEVTLAVGKNAEASEKLVSVYNKLQAAKNAGIVLDATDIDELSEGFENLAMSVGLSERQLETLVVNLEQIAPELEKFINNKGFDSLAEKATKTTQKFTSAKSELRALTNLINSGQLEGVELETAIRRAAELTDEIGDTRAQIAQLASDTRSLDLMVESVSALGAGFQIAEGAAALFGDESEDMQKALVKLNAIMALSQGLQQAMEIATTRGGIASKIAAGAQALWTTAIGTSTGALKVFRIALASIGIGLVIAAIGILISNFDKIKESLSNTFPFFSRLGSIANGVINSIVEGFRTLSSVVEKIFDEDFSGAYAEAKKLGSNVAKAYNAGVVEADNKAANEALSKQILSVVENQKRKLAILEAGGKQTFALQKTILNNEIKALELAGAEKKEILDKQLELDILIATKQKELFDKAKQIREKALADFSKIKEELFKLSSEFKLITPEQQFEFVKEKQIENIKKAKDDLIALGKQLGKDVSKDIESFNLLLDGLAARDFTSTLAPIKKLGTTSEIEINKLTSKLKELQNIEVNFGVDTSAAQDNIKKEIEAITKNPLKSDVKPKIEIPAPTLITTGVTSIDLGSDFDIFLGDVNNFGDLLQKSLDEAFGEVGGEKAAAALNGLRSFVGALNNIAGEADQIRLDMIDAQLDQLATRREALQEGLAQELEDQKLGLANSVGSKQLEVDAIIAEETRLKAEQERIKQESAKRQFAIETATQTASLITTSIEIYKGFAGIPFGLGIPLAIAAIGSLFGFFAKTKIDAARATKLYTGTGSGQIKDFFGFANKYGETDLPGQGFGYRLYNERTNEPTNVIVSGKEMMLPESISLPNAEFFNNLRAGHYDGLNLVEVLGYYKQFKKFPALQTTTQDIKVSPGAPNKTRTRQIVPFIDKKGVAKAVVVTIDDTLADGSIIEFDL
jgi:hypothetical protein